MTLANLSEEKRGLTGMRLEELTSVLGSRARALETLRWLYAQPSLPARLPNALPGVTPSAWAKLRDVCELPEVEVRVRQQSADGTTKYLLGLRGAAVETVLIPAKGRSTVCVSSQVGCTRNCGFCATATLGFTRNLRASEMVAQYLVARADARPGAPARNVVFMGQGEPMDNLDEVLAAVEVLTQSPAPQLAAHQITVSTSGVLPGIERFLKECRASLALSLNGSTNEGRGALMVQTKTWPIERIMETLREDRRQNPKRVHFIEYVLFAGVNDADDDADRVVAHLAGVNARLNLIPHNAFDGNPLRPPTRERVLAFQQRVVAAGVQCLVRWPRGREIAAACGQLALAGG
jgi:23S rRNA (adenine2503-C2)-methyltransferase